MSIILDEITQDFLTLDEPKFMLLSVARVVNIICYFQLLKGILVFKLTMDEVMNLGICLYL